MAASTIGSINLLSEAEKREIYTRLVPPELSERFQIPPSFTDRQGNSLVSLKCAAGSTDVEAKLFHEFGFSDPILYGHLTDTSTAKSTCCCIY